MTDLALADLVAALARIVGSDQVLADAQSVAPFGHAESGLDDLLPGGVARAGGTAEVSAVLRLCSKRGVPVTPCAGRSGKSGGSLPVRGGLSLSLARMNRVLSVRREDLVGVVQPGVVTAD